MGGVVGKIQGFELHDLKGDCGRKQLFRKRYDASLAHERAYMV